MLYVINDEDKNFLVGVANTGELRKCYYQAVRFVKSNQKLITIPVCYI